MSQTQNTNVKSPHLFEMVSQLEPHPDVDYFKYQHARIPHFGAHLEAGSTEVNLKTYTYWEADLVAQGGVADWLWATEPQILGKVPYKGRTRTFGDKAYNWKTHATTWRRRAQIPARLETIAMHLDYDDGVDWLCAMIFKGESYADIAAALSMNTTTLMNFMLDNVPVEKLKATRRMKTEDLIHRAESATARVLSEDNLATASGAALAESQARAISGVTAMTRFIAAARIEEFSGVKKVETGGAAHIHISFDPKDD